MHTSFALTAAVSLAALVGFAGQAGAQVTQTEFGVTGSPAPSRAVPHALFKKLRCGDTASQTASLARQEAMAMCLINKTRAHYGRRVLRTKPMLMKGSTRKSARIGRCATFTHNPCGDPVNRELVRLGFVGTMGENIYMATGHYASAWGAYEVWMNSPAHRRNILARDWRFQGIDARRGLTVDGVRQDQFWVSTFSNR